MSDSLTLSECSQVFEAGTQCPLANIVLNFTGSYTQTTGGETVAFSFNATWTLTRVPYNASIAPGSDEFCVVRQPCSGLLEILPVSWAKTFPSVFNTSDSSIACSHVSDMAVGADLELSGPDPDFEHGMYGWQFFITGPAAPFCAAAASIFNTGSALNQGVTDSNPYSRFTLAELGDNTSVENTLGAATVTYTVNP